MANPLYTAARSRPRSPDLRVEIIDHVEQADAAPVGELVVHEVHRPVLDDRSRHRQRQRFLAHQAVTWLDSQVQFELAVDPVDTLVVPFEALHVAQIQEAQPEAPVPLVVRQPYQPVGNKDVFSVQLGLVAVAGLANDKCLARQLD